MCQKGVDVMDQIKTGRFIASLRKEKGLTQLELADSLGISDKTVSKWERGAGLPEVSLMLPLCEALSVSVNELLVGEKLNDSEYKAKAEDTIMDLVKENEKNRKRLFQSVSCGIITFIAVIALVIIASYLEMPTAFRILILIFALATAATGVIAASMLDAETGYFECPDCGNRFAPSFKEYVNSLHTFTQRRLKCPECGKIGWCRHITVKKHDWTALKK